MAVTPAESSIYDVGDVETAKGGFVDTSSSNDGSVRLGESEGGVFATGGNIESYKPIPEYEGAHRYDPKFQWSDAEERKLVRRVCGLSRSPQTDTLASHDARCAAGQLREHVVGFSMSCDTRGTHRADLGYSESWTTRFAPSSASCSLPSSVSQTPCS